MIFSYIDYLSTFFGLKNIDNYSLNISTYDIFIMYMKLSPEEINLLEKKMRYYIDNINYSGIISCIEYGYNINNIIDGMPLLHRILLPTLIVNKHRIKYLYNIGVVIDTLIEYNYDFELLPTKTVLYVNFNENTISNKAKKNSFAFSINSAYSLDRYIETIIYSIQNAKEHGIYNMSHRDNLLTYITKLCEYLDKKLNNK